MLKIQTIHLNLTEFTLYAYLQWCSTSESPAILPFDILLVFLNTFILSVSAFVQWFSILANPPKCFAGTLQRWGRWSTGGSSDPLKSLNCVSLHFMHISATLHLFRRWRTVVSLFWTHWRLKARTKHQWVPPPAKQTGIFYFYFKIVYL